MFRFLASLIGVLLTFVLLWYTNVPLGIPGEWTWDRHPLAPDFPFNLVPSLFWVGVLGSYVWAGSLRHEVAGSGTPRFLKTWLLGLAILSFCTLSGLREAAPVEFRSAKSAFVLYFPGSSGYFTEASKVRETREFLRSYGEIVKQGDVLHQGTHPPGLIVGYRGVMWLCRPRWVQDVLISTMPQDLRDAFRIISEQSRSSGGPALTDHDRSVLWAASLIMQACVAATVIPLYTLLRLHLSGTSSWQLVSFWPLIPALNLFMPKSDTCFPFIGCMVLSLWLYGLKRRSWLLCIAAGFVFWLGMILSLAMLPVACLAGLLTIWKAASDDAPTGQRPVLLELVQKTAAGGVGFLIPSIVLWSTTGCNLFEIWRDNFRNHAGFYQQFPRTYWKWLLENPLELGFAVGLPLSYLALVGLVRAIRNFRAPASVPALASFTTWFLLWISGKNMGEAARLWIFLMPWFIWTSGTDWEFRRSQQSPATQRQWWLGIWLCQFVATLVTITKVAGFHL